MIVTAFLFWLCWCLLLYSYALYPLLLLFFSRFVKRNYQTKWLDELPHVSLIIAARNEEKVIAEKLDSIVATNYPHDKIELLIGSDASTDNTDQIIERYALRYPFIRLVKFSERRGKPAIVNQLATEAKHALLLLSDANVMFMPDTIHELVNFFADARIGLVGANIMNRFEKSDGIAAQEKNYIGIENRIKHWEGSVFGKMIGPFGGAYMLRKFCYVPVPFGFAVDDFFIGMSVLLNGHDAVLARNAVCVEDVSHDIEQEHRRKRRIATGNFQNMIALKRIFLKPYSAMSFCFFSHKVIRWFGPVLMIVAFVCNLFLLRNNLYAALLFVQLFAAAWTGVDAVLLRRGVNTGALRYIAYFCRMNVALLQGMFDYLKGKQAHVWEPTERN